MNAALEQIVRAVAERRVTRRVELLAARLVEREERQAELAVKRAPIPSLTHHAAVRRAEEREREACAAAVWEVVLSRTLVDHRMIHACEACHRPMSHHALEPHHLELGAGGRRDAPEVVMALCGGCHRIDPGSAHRSPRAFAQKIVVPWLQAHLYPLPNRKEYRT